MVYATLICITVVAIILGVLFVIFGHGVKLLNFAVALLFPTASLLLALVSANLSSVNNGYTLFICIALSLLIAIQAFKCVKTEELNKGDILFLGLANAVTLICFAVAGMTLARVSIFPLLAGLFLGIGTGCIVLIFKKLNLAQSLMTILNMAFGGLILGQAISLLMTRTNLVTGVLYLFAGLALFADLILNVFSKQNHPLQISSRAALMLGLILMSISIFFVI